MKINFFSNAMHSPTGYGNQTKLFVPRLKALGHEMTLTAFYGVQGAPLVLDGIKTYPLVKHPYGQDVMQAHADHAQADAIISLLDIWVVSDQLTTPWFPWFPIDCEPIPPRVLEQSARATKGITMSKFGQRMATQAGLETFYVPHGVDTKVFRPVDRVEARKKLGLPLDKFIVGMVAANKGNPPRKAFHEHIAAFAALHMAHPDTLLYLHTDDGTHGGEVVNLIQYCQRMGLKPGEDVLFPDQYIYQMGFPDDYLVSLYNAFDVKMLVSLGEGFGIPLIEAQACGCPVITGAWTAMEELCFSGWKIPKSEAAPYYIDFFDAFQYRVSVQALEQRLLAAYEMRGNEDYRKRARDGALAYDADKVVEKYWKPVLREIEKMAGDINSARACEHDWHGVGLYNKDGSISVPCKKCGSEKIGFRDGREIIVAHGFVNDKTGVTYAEADGLEWLLTRETVREYDHDLNLPASPKVIDIGAHVGVVSMYLAKKYGAEVWAYEPLPENYRRLVLNIERNGLQDKVHPFNLAVTGDGRDVTITANMTNSGGNSIYDGGETVAHSTTFAEILKQTGAVDLLKIDCEGAEFEILADVEILRGNVGMVRGEVHNKQGDGEKLITDIKAIIPNTEMVVLK